MRNNSNTSISTITPPLTHSSDEEDILYRMSSENSTNIIKRPPDVKHRYHRVPIQVAESLCPQFYDFPLGSYSSINTPTTSLEQQYPSDQEYYIGLKRSSKRKFSIRKKSLF
ncbi:2309_t:CDS:1, partial [Scutellospora calospora]